MHANIVFDWQYLNRDLIPKHMNIVIPNNFPAMEHNEARAQKQLIKDEIKFNFTKKRNSIVTINNTVMLVLLTVSLSYK